MSPEEGLEEETQEVSLLLFGLSTEFYALRIEDASEVISLPQYTPVPRTPPYLLGVCFRRGPLLPLLDLGRRLGLRQGFRRGLLGPSRSDRPAVVIAKSRLGEMGLLVDRVMRVAKVPAAAIQRTDLAPCILGSVATGNYQAYLLDLEAIGLQPPEDRT